MKELFCKIHTRFYGEPLSEPKQVTHHKMTGEELKQFSEFYFSQRLDESELKHFYRGKKAELIMIGFFIGFVLSGLMAMAILF